MIHAILSYVIIYFDLAKNYARQAKIINYLPGMVIEQQKIPSINKAQIRKTSKFCDTYRVMDVYSNFYRF